MKRIKNRAEGNQPIARRFAFSVGGPRRAASAVFIFYTNSIRRDRLLINNRNNFINAGYDIDINRFGGLQAGLDNEGRGQA